MLEACRFQSHVNFCGFMALYAYCLSDELSCATFRGSVAGVGGAGPRLLPSGEIAAVVSDFDGERVSVERAHVFAHERVVHSVLQHVTPLPFRFGTLLSAERLQSYIEANRDGLKKALEHVRGSVEMSVKIIWNAEEIKREGDAFETAGEADREPQAVVGEGARYLAARRREILGDEHLKGRAEELAAWLEERVGEFAADSEMSLRPNEQLVLRAAFLVGRPGLSGYQQRVEEARRERPDLRFLTSGPWPPYSFSNIKP